MKRKIFLFGFILFVYSTSFGATIGELYEVKPSPSACKEGVLKDVEKQEVLQELNAIRLLHGLKAVAYHSADDLLTAKSALIMQANATITHHPDKSYKCWTAEGEQGSGRSNIHIGYTSSTKTVTDSAELVKEWLIDDRVDSLGHRRWFLDPFLKYVSFGRVDGKPVVDSEWATTTGAAISVINDEVADIRDTKTEFVAYPYRNYPNELFKKSWFFSFTALYDRTSTWHNKANYSGAKITVTDENGNSLPVHSVSYDNTGFGVPNIIQWKVNGLQDNIRYTVRIAAVQIKGKPRDYTYWFKLSDTPLEQLLNKGSSGNKRVIHTSVRKKSNSSSCVDLFEDSTPIPWKTFSKTAPAHSGTLQVLARSKDYLEFQQTLGKSKNTFPVYGIVTDSSFVLINPLYQEVWHGRCWTDGGYGTAGDFYFYLGSRQNVTVREIQERLQKK